MTHSSQKEYLLKCGILPGFQRLQGDILLLDEGDNPGIYEQRGVYNDLAMVCLRIVPILGCWSILLVACNCLSCPVCSLGCAFLFSRCGCPLLLLAFIADRVHPDRCSYFFSFRLGRLGHLHHIERILPGMVFSTAPRSCIRLICYDQSHPSAPLIHIACPLGHWELQVSIWQRTTFVIASLHY
jgi:hypothetical protein